MLKRVLYLTLAAALLIPVTLKAEDPEEFAPEEEFAPASFDLEDPFEDENMLEPAAYLPVGEMTASQNLTELGIRFGINLIASLIIVGIFYYRKSRRRDYFFTFMVFSTAMLLLLYVMGNGSVGIGLTLGLFAIFGIIRYRTETVPIREMTYLFVIIAVAAINGLAPVYHLVGASGNNPHYEIQLGIVAVLALSNILIIAVIGILESGSIVAHTTTKLVLYDRIDLIVPEKREELTADLEKRLGVKIDGLEIGHVDFLRDAAFIKVRYTLPKGETNTINTITRAKDYTE